MKRAIILAAGMGTRLGSMTKKQPKCLTKIKGIDILNRQVEQFKSVGINSIIVVTGHLSDKIDRKDIVKVHNNKYAQTNMLFSLFCAKDFFKEGVIVSYGDIVFNKTTLLKLIDSKNEITIVSDKSWRQYWGQRFENPIDDIESFEIRENNLVKSLGKKVKSLDGINGQYIGLIKFSDKGSKFLTKMYYDYEKLNKKINGNHIHQAYMTDILNLLAEKKKLSYVEIDRGWFEIDTLNDLKVANKYLNW